MGFTIEFDFSSPFSRSKNDKSLKKFEELATRSESATKRLQESLVEMRKRGYIFSPTRPYLSESNLPELGVIHSIKEHRDHGRRCSSV